MSKTNDAIQLLKVPQAAEILAISARKLWELTNRGEIPCIKIDRGVRYDASDLANYIARQRIGGAK